jgi:thioredoxin-like negative regulator of GroEL
VDQNLMLERLLVLAMVAVAVGASVLLVRHWNTGRLTSRLGTRDPLWQTLGETPDGRHTLIAFSTPSCAACHQAQAPAVKAVEQQLGSATLRVIHVDAARRPNVAEAFGVLTVPSTAVLAPAGEVVAINQGFTPTGKLVDQLQRA